MEAGHAMIPRHAMLQARLERANPWLVEALVVGTLAAALVPMVFFRLVDADEGIYLFNARLVLEGRVPYSEFHYPQMPLLPYVYAAWMRVAGVSWYGGRLLSSLFAVGLGLALYHHLVRVTGHRRWGLLAVGLFASNTLVFAWLPLVKTFALATLLLFLAYSALEGARARWRFFASGLLLAAAVDTRLYVAILVPVFAFAVWRCSRRALAWFSAGLALALVPNLFFVLIDPVNFFFNIVGHHGVRSEWGFVGAAPQKLTVLLGLLGVNEWSDDTSLQVTVLGLAWACFVAGALRLRAPLPTSVPVTVVLALVSFVPTPAYSQYFCMVIPFVVLDVVRFGVAVAEEGATTIRAVIAPRLGHALAVVGAVYVLAGAFGVYRFTADGGNVPGVFVRADVKNWRIPAINDVSKAIDEAMPPAGTTALSFWPGYFVESRTTSFPRLENPFTLWYSSRMTPVQISRHHFITRPELVQAIHRRAVPVVVLGNWMFDTKPYYRAELLRNGYVLVRMLDDTEIYRWSARGS